MDKPKLPSFAKIGEKVDSTIELADAAFNRLSDDLIQRGGASALVANFLRKRFADAIPVNLVMGSKDLRARDHVDIGTPEERISPYSDADRLMGRMVNLVGREANDDETDKTNDRFMSRTVLNPDNTLIGFVPYGTVVRNKQELHLENIILKSQLPDAYADDINNEIVMGFTQRYSKNTEASNRLEMALRGQELDSETANLIWRAKTGDLVMHEVADLLFKFPQMKSIEAGHSIHPLDKGGFLGMDKFVYEQLLECSRKEDISMQVWADRAPERESRYINLTNSQFSAGVEEKVAEITKNGVTIELARHDKMILLPPNVPLNGVLPNFVKLKKTVVNQQPIETALSWSVKRVENVTAPVAKSRLRFRK